MGEWLAWGILSPWNRHPLATTPREGNGPLADKPKRFAALLADAASDLAPRVYRTGVLLCRFCAGLASRALRRYP